MSRELKFRAWQTRDREKGFMNYDPSLGNGFDGPGTLSGADSSDILMQYTGIQDKIGKDIYEDDIVRLIDKRMPKDYREQIVTVDFENGCFMFGGFFPHGLEGQEVEVIGNIYQNPELLGQKG